MFVTSTVSTAASALATTKKDADRKALGIPDHVDMAFLSQIRAHAWVHFQRWKH